MMTGSAVKAPDITYDALIKQGFTDATIGRAIRDTGWTKAASPWRMPCPAGR